MDRTAWQIGLGVLALGTLTTPGLTSGDAAIHLDVASSLLERGSAELTIDPGDRWVPTQARAGGLFFQRDGVLRAAGAPGAAWIAVPFVAIGSLGAKDAPPIAEVVRPLFDAGDVRPMQHDPRVVAFALIGPISAALAVALAWLCAAALGLSRRGRWSAVLALGIGSPLLAYAGTSWTQLPVTALSAAALLALCRAGSIGRGRAALLAGLALGAAAAVRPDMAALAPAFVAGWLRLDRADPRRAFWDAARIVAPVALVVAGLALLGVPFGSDGWRLGGAIEGAAGLLISPRTGLLVYAPFVALAPWGLPRLGAAAWPAVGSLLACLLLYAGWFDWTASLAYGPRFLLPALPALALAFGAAVDHSQRRWVPWIAIGLGLAVQIPGALVMHARIEEPDRFLHPTFVSAWRALLAEGADSASTHVIAYPLVALAAAVTGLIVSRRGQPGGSRYQKLQCS